MKKIRLGVNVDHVATLRQVRGGTTSYPSVSECVTESVRGGADQITIHLREDRRHIQDEDLKLLSKKCPVLLNLEMGATTEMLKIAKKYKPDICCLVPEKRKELTTEGGLDVASRVSYFKSYVAELKKSKIPVSMFVDPSLEQVWASFEAGAYAVELHTGHWVLYRGAKRSREWDRLVNAASLAHALGLKVHAGHGLDLKTTKEACKLPFIEELNIGHSIVCYALTSGIRKAVQSIKKQMK